MPKALIGKDYEKIMIDPKKLALLDRKLAYSNCVIGGILGLSVKQVIAWTTTTTVNAFTAEWKYCNKLWRFKGGVSKVLLNPTL